MRAPKILYHGTTYGRYVMGIQREGLRGNMPKNLHCDEFHYGHVFLTDDRREAAIYSLMTWFFDKVVPKMSAYCKSPKCLVLGVQTSKLRKFLSIDPEYVENKKWFEDRGTWEDIKEKFGAGVWYKYKGSIPRTSLFVADVLDITKQHKFVLEELAFLTQTRFLAERFDAEKLESIKKELMQLIEHA